jgi:CheY-like chemotaxis protein
MASTPTILLCDCISWRLDLFGEALARIAEGAHSTDRLARVRLGYRLWDNLAFIVITPGRSTETGLGGRLAAVTRLPGLRVLDLDSDMPVNTIIDRLWATCEVTSDASPVGTAIAKIRATLGMTDDRRRALRLTVGVPQRFEAAGAWFKGTTRDISSHGVFVDTQSPVPSIERLVQLELFAQSESPVLVQAKVMRHAPGGFGARLLSDEAAQEAIYTRIRALRVGQFGDAGAADARVPVNIDVSVLIGDESLTDTIENLSRKGAFIRSAHPPVAGAPVEIALPQAPAAKIGANVVRVVRSAETGQPTGFAVAFKELTEKTRSLIDKMVASATKQRFARILVAVSQDAARKKTAAALAEQGCQVVEASNAQETFHRLIDELLGLDLLVLDGALAAARSGELLHRIRRMGGELELPIVVLSLWADEHREALTTAGATEVISGESPERVAQRCVEIVSARRAAAA